MRDLYEAGGEGRVNGQRRTISGQRHFTASDNVGTAMKRKAREVREDCARIAEDWTPRKSLQGGIGEIMFKVIRGIAAAMRAAGPG